MGGRIGRIVHSSTRETRVGRRERQHGEDQQALVENEQPPHAGGLQGLQALPPPGAAAPADVVAAPPPGLLTLPPELVANIGRRLPLGDRISLSNTNQRLRAMRSLYFPSDLAGPAAGVGVDELPGLLALLRRCAPEAREAPLRRLMQRFVADFVPQARTLGAAQRLLAAVGEFPPARRSPLLRALAAHVARDIGVYDDAVRGYGVGRFIEGYDAAATAIQEHDGGFALDYLTSLKVWDVRVRTARIERQNVWLVAGHWPRFL